MDGVGVVERFAARSGGGCEMGLFGLVESLPDVVKGVRSRISGKSIRQVFLLA